MNRIVTVLLILVFWASHCKAQDTAHFKGKTYLVYPYDITHSNLRYIKFDEKELEFSNMLLPPVIGSLKDGEYLVYRRDVKYYHTPEDTSIYYRNIYAVITIKNGMKEGLATFYLEDEQSKPFLEVPYSKDQIHGSFYFKVSSNYYDNYYYYGLQIYKNSELRNYPFIGDREFGQVYENKLMRLNFNDGEVDGTQSFYHLCGKGDTLLYLRFEVKQGLMNGPYLFRYYGVDYKLRSGLSNWQKFNRQKDLVKFSDKAYINYEMTGSMLNGKHQGNFLYVDKRSELRREMVFNNDTLKSYILFVKNKKLQTVYFSRDSIFKYLPNANEQSKIISFSDFGFYKFGSSITDYLVIKENDNNIKTYHYKLGDSLSSNYFRQFDGEGDTLINGRFVYYCKIDNPYWLSYYKKYSDGNKRADYFKLYSIFELNLISTYYDKNKVMIESFSKDGRLIERTIIDSSIFKDRKTIVQDSLKPILKSVIAQGLDTLRHFCIYPDGNAKGRSPYYYEEIVLRGNKYLKCEKKYHVKGIGDSLQIVSQIDIRRGNDHLSLIDTIYRNGKCLYQIDTFFHFLVRQDMLSAILMDSAMPTHQNLFLKHVVNFLLPLPSVHRSVKFNGIEYYGSVTFNLTESSPKMHIDYLVMDFVKNPYSKGIVINMDFVANPDKFEKKKGAKYLGEIEAQFFNGLFKGHCSYDGPVFAVGGRAYFHNNLLNGEIRLNYKPLVVKMDDFDSYNDLQDAYFEFKQIEDNIHTSYTGNVRMRIDVLRYFNGKPNGQWMVLDNNFRPAYQLTFKDGKLNGDQYVFNSTQSDKYIKFILSMKNDVLDGRYFTLSPNGVPEVSGGFKDGNLDGCFTAYNPSDTSAGKYTHRLFIDSGRLYGEKLIRSYDGANLKCKIIIDKKGGHLDNNFYWKWYGGSSFGLSYVINEKLRIDDLNTPFTNVNGRNYHTYYYFEGQEFSRGFKFDNTPIDTWRFYRQDGSIYKMFIFKDSVVRLPDSAYCSTFGKVFTYYPEGGLMYIGWALNNKMKFACESDAELPVEDDWYISFLDTNGRELLVTDSSYVVEYQSNGLKLKEGPVMNGLMHGFWTIYNSHGLVTEFGMYVNGKREGRWLSGDLDGLHLSENMCFMDASAFNAWVEQFGGRLKLAQNYYKNGIIVRTEEINVESNR